MAATDWATRTARRCLCRWCCRGNWFESRRFRGRKNSFAGGWERSWKPRRSALRLRARILGGAVGANTSTSRTRRRFGLKRKFCARRWGARGGFNGPGRSGRMPRRRLGTATARNGNCAGSRTSAAGPGNSGIGYFEAGSTRLVGVDQCTILSPRLAETLDRLRALLGKSNVLAAIDEIEAFGDSAGEKVLLNLSAEKLSESAESIAKALREEIPFRGIDPGAGPQGGHI